MWPAGFEPATPRVSGERSTAELQPRALAEPESNRRPPPHQRGALPPELSAVVASMCDGRGWDRTSSLRYVRPALSRLSYPRVNEKSFRGESNPCGQFGRLVPRPLGH